MMHMLVDDASLRKVLDKFSRLKLDEERGLKAVLNTTALLVRTTAIRNLHSGGKTGVTYYRLQGDKYMTVTAGQGGPPVAFIPGAGSNNLSLTHTASAPGEAPASDTGQLANSIEIKLEAMDATIYSDSSRAKYGAWLEYGTRKIEPRPWLVPALYANKQVFFDEVEKMIKKLTNEFNA